MGRRRPHRPTGGKPWAFEDPVVRERFFEAIRKGANAMHAARHAGTTDRSLQRIVERAREASEALDAGEALSEADLWAVEFVEEYQRARADVAVDMLGVIRDVAHGGHLIRRRHIPQRGGDPIVEEDYAPPDFRAADTLLKRSYSREYAEATQLDVQLTGPGGGPVQIESQASDAALALAAQISRSLEMRGSEVLVPEDRADEIRDAEVVDETRQIGAG